MCFICLKDGTFLVRKSVKGGEQQPYTLVVLYQRHIYNLKVRVRQDGQVALGNEKDDELVRHWKLFDFFLLIFFSSPEHKNDQISLCLSTIIYKTSSLKVLGQIQWNSMALKKYNKAFRLTINNIMANYLFCFKEHHF